MFSCIVPCAKPMANESDEEHERRHESGIPRTKQAAKSITSQLKDIALKVTGSYRQSKPSKRSTSYQRRHPDSDTTSESHVGGTSVTSTPNHPDGITDPTLFDGSFVGIPTPPRGHDTAPPALSAVVGMENECQELLSEVEEGIIISFASLPNGGNDLRRIRFSREMFDRNLAQRWWIENYDRIRELYNVLSFNGQVANPSGGSEDEQGRRPHSRLTFALEASSSLREWIPENQNVPRGNIGNQRHEQLARAASGYIFFNAGSSSSVEQAASVTFTPPRSPRFEPPMTNIATEAEWVEQYEPGVFITIRQSSDGTRNIRRLRFSRDRFNTESAKIWWLENKKSVEARYL